MIRKLVLYACFVLIQIIVVKTLSGSKMSDFTDANRQHFKYVHLTLTVQP